MTTDEIAGDYERFTGEVIVETLSGLDTDPLDMPAALVASHGPFTWGRDASDAVRNAIALEAVAAMAHRTHALRGWDEPDEIDPALLRRHFSRKHGPGAYYGQPGHRDR
jgi:L-ribulose-5-phosphate 4-epimerase